MNPFIRDIVLPLLRKLQRDLGGPVSSRIIACRLGYARRTAYGWLAALQSEGLAELRGKRWVAVG